MKITWFYKRVLAMLTVLAIALILLIWIVNGGLSALLNLLLSLLPD